MDTGRCRRATVRTWSCPGSQRTRPPADPAAPPPARPLHEEGDHAHRLHARAHHHAPAPPHRRRAPPHARRPSGRRHPPRAHGRIPRLVRRAPRHRDPRARPAAYARRRARLPAPARAGPVPPAARASPPPTRTASPRPRAPPRTRVAPRAFHRAQRLHPGQPPTRVRGGPPCGTRARYRRSAVMTAWASRASAPRGAACTARSRRAPAAPVLRADAPRGDRPAARPSARVPAHPHAARLAAARILEAAARMTRAGARAAPRVLAGARHTGARVRPAGEGAGSVAGGGPRLGRVRWEGGVRGPITGCGVIGVPRHGRTCRAVPSPRRAASQQPRAQLQKRRRRLARLRRVAPPATGELPPSPRSRGWLPLKRSRPIRTDQKAQKMIDSHGSGTSVPEPHPGATGDTRSRARSVCPPPPRTAVPASCSRTFDCTPVKRADGAGQGSAQRAGVRA